MTLVAFPCVVCLTLEAYLPEIPSTPHPGTETALVMHECLPGPTKLHTTGPSASFTIKTPGTLQAPYHAFKTSHLCTHQVLRA